MDSVEEKRLYILILFFLLFSGGVIEEGGWVTPWGYAIFVLSRRSTRTQSYTLNLCVLGGERDAAAHSCNNIFSMDGIYRVPLGASGGV